MITDEQVKRAAIATRRKRYGDGNWQQDVDMCRAALEAAQLPPAQESFQGRVAPWMLACFGHEISLARQERNHRFFEEAAELVQSGGMTRSEAHQLVDYTYDRPTGAMPQVYLDELNAARATISKLEATREKMALAVSDAVTAKTEALEKIAKLEERFEISWRDYAREHHRAQSAEEQIAKLEAENAKLEDLLKSNARLAHLYGENVSLEAALATCKRDTMLAAAEIADSFWPNGTQIAAAIRAAIPTETGEKP